MSIKSNPFDRSSTDIPLIRFVIHSGSLLEEIRIKNSAARRLIKSNCLKEIEILPLPSSDGDVCQFFLSNGVVCTQYYQAESGLILKASDGSQYGLIYGAKQNQWKPITPNSLVSSEDISATKHSDYLVVGANDPILSANTHAKNIVTAEKAVELIRILLTNHGLYYITANNYTTNEGGYYLYRFKNLFRSFQYAWSVAVYAHGHGLSEEVFNYLDSLSRRLEFICMAYDKVCFFSLKTANNDTQSNQLYHLAYYVMLVTGVFDSLAHIISGFYHLSFKSMLDISLHIKPKIAASVFINKLSYRNSALCDYLTKSDVRNKIHAFYPIRDALQHRELLHGIRYSNSSHIDMNLFQLTDEALEGLFLVSPASACIVNLREHYMDPIVFITWAQKELIGLVNDILSYMDWDSIIKILPEDVIEKIHQSNDLFQSNIGKFLKMTGDDQPLYF